MRLFALAFVLGALLLQSSAQLPAGNPGLVAVALGLALALPRFNSLALRAAVLLAAGALAGFGVAQWRAETSLADFLPYEWEGRDIAVTGIVAGLPQPGERGTRFAFEVEAVHTPGAGVPRRIALTWFRDRRGEEGGAPPQLAAGERWQLVVRVKRPRGLANPHGFDFEPWALERGIRATGYVRAKPAPVRLEARVDGWPWTLHRWRGEIREAMAARLEGAPRAGILVALAIGDQDAIGPADWKTFWRTGVGHLVSISGLHITMLGALAFGIAAFLWVRVPGLALRLPASKAGAIAAVLAAGAYTLLAGYAVPALRTFVMLAAIAACVLANRHGSSSRMLAIAALAVLLVDPWAVLAPGFWLSFGAVAAIFYALALRAGMRSAWRAAVSEQLAVTVAMLPMLVALFQEVSVVSPLANAFAIPVVSLVVVPLTLGGVFLGWEAPLRLAHALLEAMMVPLEALAAMPGAVLESHAPAAWTVAAALVGCAWLLAPRGFPMRAAGAAWMAPMFLVLPPSPAAGQVWIDVLDVGHGLAIIVRTQHHALAYDAGPSWSEASDAGSRVVVPHLRGEGVRRLDGVVISHADDDHAGGARSVIAARDPSWLLSPLAADHALHRVIGISRLCRRGMAWTWDGIRFEVLHPFPEALAERRRENDRSCALRIASEGASLLIAGDLEARSEAELVAHFGARLRSDVLLVPHHGSKSSSTALFLEAIAPREAIVSAGHRNRFHHPNAAVVARYRERGVRLHRTDASGALRVVLPAEAGKGVTVRRIAPEVRYWSDRRAGNFP